MINKGFFNRFYIKGCSGAWELIASNGSFGIIYMHFTEYRKARKNLKGLTKDMPKAGWFIHYTPNQKIKDS